MRKICFRQAVSHLSTPLSTLKAYALTPLRRSNRRHEFQPRIPACDDFTTDWLSSPTTLGCSQHRVIAPAICSWARLLLGRFPLRRSPALTVAKGLAQHAEHPRRA